MYMIDIKVPTVGESISEVTLLKWTKQNGEYVERDEVIAELESEKATFEVNAEQAGTLKQSANEGDTLKIGDILASIDESASKPAGNGKPAEEKKPEIQPQKSEGQETPHQHPAVIQPHGSTDVKTTPVAAAMIADKKIDPSKIAPSGAGGKIIKDDVLAALSNPGKVT